MLIIETIMNRLIQNTHYYLLQGALIIKNPVILKLFSNLKDGRKKILGFVDRGYCIEGRSSFSSLQKLEIQWQAPHLFFNKGIIINPILDRKIDIYEDETQSTKSHMRCPEIIHAKKIFSR